MTQTISQQLDAPVRALAAAQTQLLRDLAELDRSEAWKAEGYGSMDQWLVARYGFGKRTAVSYVKTAQQLASEPEIADLLARGAISFDQARAMCRLSDTDDDTAPEEIRHKTADQIHRQALRQEKMNLDDAVRAHRWRYLRWDWSTDRHVLHLRGSLPHDQGAVLVKALDRLIRRMPPIPEDSIYDSYETYAADAIHQLASMRLGADRDADRATVVAHVDAVELVDPASDAVAVLDGGPAIPVEMVRRLACDGRIEWVAEDASGSAVGIGRASRQIPAWLARQVKRRDHGCRFPGCDRTRWVHIHHLVHWAHGGPTDLDNLITLCDYHHRMVHECGWTISGGPGGDVVFVRPVGLPFAYRDPGVVDPEARAHRRNRGPDPWIPKPGRDP